VEDQLVSKTLFTTMKAAGPLPEAVPGDAASYLRERRVLLEERLRDVDGRAARHMLTDVKITGATLKITPPQAVTPETAERLADRVHTVMPRVRFTELLAEVARWTGLADCFTQLRTGLPAEDQRVMLTAVLADATNLGLTRMAEACSVASYRQLAWTAGWHLSEEGYGRALARIVAAQQAHSLSARLALPCPARTASTSRSAATVRWPAPSTRTRAPDRRSPSTPGFPAATRRSTPRRFPCRKARRRMSSTGCSIMAARSMSPSTIPTAAASPTTCSRCATCWASASRPDPQSG
jgi:hypothetical protein